jgi:hypothetical protein
MKERLKGNCASRWSAVGRMVGTTKKNGLTRAGLLMEVADNPLGGGFHANSIARAMGCSRQ